MNSKLKSELVDDVNPEWTAPDFAKAKPASSVLGQIFSPAVRAEMLKPRHYGESPTTKTALSA